MHDIRWTMTEYSVKINVNTNTATLQASFVSDLQLFAFKYNH